MATGGRKTKNRAKWRRGEKTSEREREAGAGSGKRNGKEEGRGREDGRGERKIRQNSSPEG